MASNTPKQDNRNYGVDLLRIVAALYVVLVHVLGTGGVVVAAPRSSLMYYVSSSWFMWVFCAVNIFAVISGYVGYSDQPRPYHYSNYLVMWLQVVVLDLSVTAMYVLLGLESVTLSELVDSCLPISRTRYWYFTAYSGLFFLIPLLNHAVRNSDKVYLRRAFLLLIVVASLYSTVFDPWDIDGGYSFLWLAVLYLLGAIMKKCGIGQTIPSGMLLLGIVLCTAVSWGIKLYEDQFGRFISVCVWQSYSSPSYLLSAMLHVLLFSRMRFSQWQKNCIRFAAPGAFAVYILNCHSYIWKHMLSGKFSQYASQGIGTMVFHVIAFSVAFVVAGIVIDYLRRKVFVFLHIDQLAKWLVALCTKVLDIVMIPKVKIK